MPSSNSPTPSLYPISAYVQAKVVIEERVARILTYAVIEGLLSLLQVAGDSVGHSEIIDEHVA